MCRADLHDGVDGQVDELATTQTSAGQHLDGIPAPADGVVCGEFEGKHEKLRGDCSFWPLSAIPEIRDTGSDLLGDLTNETDRPPGVSARWRLRGCRGRPRGRHGYGHIRTK
jgi:hypothetical protein